MGPFMDLPSPPLESLSLHDISTANLSAVVTFNSPLLPSTTKACSPLSSSTIHPTDQATSHIPSEQLICQHCSTPRDSQDTVLTRIYPSPPLTGSALKQSIPLPTLPHPPGMDFAHHRPTQTSELESTSHDESSAFQHDSSLSTLPILTPELRKEAPYGSRHIGPLSPPPTLALSVLELPPANSSGPPHVPGLPSPESPRRDHGEHLHKRHKRLRLHGEYDSQVGPSGIRTGSEDAQTSDESQTSFLAFSPDGTWGNQSRLSDGSSTAYSPYDHDDGYSLQWSSPMDRSSTSSLFHDDDFDRDMPPSSPRQKLLSLDMPSWDEFEGPSLEESHDHDPPLQSFPSRPALSPPDDGHPSLSPWSARSSSGHSDMDIDGPYIPPSSPRTGLLHLPVSDPDSDVSFADTIMPPEDEEEGDSPDDTPQPHSPLPRRFQPLPDFDSYDESTYLTPIPRSPRARPGLLPFFGDSYEPPPSPSSPNQKLPDIPDDGLYYPEPSYQQPSTSSSSNSIAAQPSLESEGLGLFIRSIDPPLARTPSPTEDDFGFLDIQLDPLSSDLPVDEFLVLRRMRKQALEFEQNARKREETLSEKVTAAACVLLPFGSSSASSPSLSSGSSADSEPLDPQLKRARKHELHMAMDARSEVRKQRKRSKQKSKEIGALMDFKMNRRSLIETGIDVGKGLRHLIASMVMSRRDASMRALTGRKVVGAEKKVAKTKLSTSVSTEELEYDSSCGYDEDMRWTDSGTGSRGEGEEMEMDE